MSLRLVAGGTHATTKALDCPFCAHSEVVVVEVEPEAASVRRALLGMRHAGPRSLSSNPAHAVHAWNQRIRRLSVVK